ncbi:hypothetical protein F4774DRAFT_393896 [Daldinia eschscholtzii]|nr:hypothetical protein F4774DRAFT_393896 [Daldinia eschscholtzii]
MTSKRFKTSSGRGVIPSSWRNKPHNLSSALSMTDGFSILDLPNMEQLSMEQANNVIPNTEAPVFPPCQQVVCPEIEMTDYDPALEALEALGDYPEDVEMVDAPFFPPEILEEFAALNQPDQSVPTVSEPDSKKQEVNPTQPNGASIMTPVEPPSTFEVSIIELLKTKKIYSVSYEKGKLEVSLE